MPAQTTRRWFARGFLGVALAATLTACGAHIGWDVTYTNAGNLREPAAFAVQCQSHGGHAVSEMTPEPPSGSCTMPNGDAVTCDWGARKCTTTCQSSPELCDQLRAVGIQPFALQRATPAASPLP